MGLPYSYKIKINWFYPMEDLKKLSIGELLVMKDDLIEDLTGLSIEELFDRRHKIQCINKAIIYYLDEMERTNEEYREKYKSIK
jgi:predicted metal-dependent hydrolase